MLVGRIVKTGRWWAAECEVAGIWTQGATRTEALANIADVLEAKVDQPGFKAHVTELGPDARGGITVWIEGSEPAWVAAAVLFEQRVRHGASLADTARRLGASSRNAYASYEQGRREPSLSKLRELLNAVAPDLELVIAPRRYLDGLSRGLEPAPTRTSVHALKSRTKTANGHRERRHLRAPLRPKTKKAAGRAALR